MSMESETEIARDAQGERPRGYVVGSAPESIEREIGHDEFDPVGTLTLILTYLAILAAMWVFMYFVEFLHNGLTVIG